MYDDMLAARKTNWINNFCKALANESNLLASGCQVEINEQFKGSPRATAKQCGNSFALTVRATRPYNGHS